MSTRFKDLLQEMPTPRRKPAVSTDGLFVGLGTAPEIWAQKDSRFKTELDGQEWEAQHTEPEEQAVSEDQVLNELNLSDRMTVNDLRAVRRTFARQNHPDISSGNPSVREERMKIANKIIDQEIRLRSQA